MRRDRTRYALGFGFFFLGGRFGVLSAMAQSSW